MTWVKLDDQFPQNKKVTALSNSAFRLHVSALCYCASQLTDGFVPFHAVKMIGWSSEEINDDIEALLAVGLWIKADGGYTIHDFLHYNPRSAVVKAQRERNAERQKAWRERKSRGDKPVSNASRNAVTNAVSAAAPFPYPNNTTTTTRAREAQTVEQKLESAGMMLNKGILDWLQAKESELKEHIDKLPDRAPGADLTPDDWLRAAIDEAMESAENGRFNLRYLDTILDGWEVRGFRVRPEFVKRKAKGESKGSDAMAEELQARVKVL